MFVNEVHVYRGMERKSQFELFTVKKQEDLDFPGSPLCIGYLRSGFPLVCYVAC